MGKERKDYTDNEKLVLTNQVNGICPLCLKELIYKKKQRIYSMYEVAHIYPCHPTEKEIELLKNEERLGNDPDDINNVIPLCFECHSKFDKPRTIEEYRYLLDLKKKAIKNQKIMAFFAKSDLTDEIAEIIDELQKGSWDKSPIPLNYNVLKIEQKLDFEFNWILKNQISNNILDYYLLIQQLFSNIDKNNPGTFDLISGQIKVFYLLLKREILDQETIFEKMSEWIFLKSQNKGSIYACKIIISYFIQNCEVFENVAK